MDAIIMKKGTEIHREITSEFSKIWGSDSMVKYCTNKSMIVCKLNDGNLFIIEKKALHKDFCFGMGWNAYATEEEEQDAENMAHYAATNERYFIKENHDRSMYGYMIQRLNDKRYVPVKAKQYDGNSNIVYIDFIPYFDYMEKTHRNADCQRLTAEEITCIKGAFVKAIQMHHKRIMTYLKKYGLSKVNTWTYYRD